MSGEAVLTNQRQLIVYMSYMNVTRKQTKAFYFSRAELSVILIKLCHQVANSDWRDYALDHIANCAIFSIFRHTHEQPLFTIEKHRQKGKDKALFMLRDRQKILFKGTKLSDLISYLHRLSPVGEVNSPVTCSARSSKERQKDALP